MWNNPYLNPFAQNVMPTYQPQIQPQTIPTVSGRKNAETIKLSPNGQALVLDSSDPVLYHCSADSLGNVSVTEYDITQRSEPKAEPDRLALIEQKLDRLMERFYEPDTERNAAE